VTRHRRAEVADADRDLDRHPDRDVDAHVPAATGSTAMSTAPDDASPELPAWPVLCLLWGLPIWWILGLFPFSPAVVAPVMLFYLVLRRPLLLAPGTLSYLALVAWMVTGILVIEPGDEFGLLVKFIQWAAVGVLIVYVVNARAQLTRDRILAGLTAMWVVVIAGGYLGMLLPNGRLSTTVGSVLPAGIRTNPYAQQLLFPQFAEIQTPYGGAVFERPAAPFYYANSWGAAMAFLVPVVIAFALSRGTAKARIFTVIGLGLAIPPAVAANNRGMLLALAVVVVVVAVRMAAQGRLEAVFGIIVVAVGAGFLMVRLGLLESLTERETVGRSSEGRGDLYLETFQRTLKSPILGYGAPRDSFTSEITVGTQGAVWAAMFCCGFVGLALLLYFLFGAVVRTWHLRSPSDLWLNATLLSTFVMSGFYGLEGMLPAYGILVAMMLRDGALDRSRRPRAG
jgi:hypothetical protein